MSERVNVYYKPAELEAALEVLNKIIQNTRRDPADLIKALYAEGYRLVKVK
jgi:hypothetical protein